jgi:hypothetical protein
MLPPVFALLKQSAAVKNIVGTNPPRIYRHGNAPQDKAIPYVTWFLVVGTPENNLSDPPPDDRMTVQVDCWHPTDTGVDLLATAVRDALEPHGHVTGILIDERDTATRLYRMALQCDLIEGRPSP